MYVDKSSNITVWSMYMDVLCVHYLCLIGRFYMFNVGHVDKSSLYDTLYHCNILSTHHHHHHVDKSSNMTIWSAYIEVEVIYIYTYVCIYLCLYI
jgi:hypothetical protein